MENNGWRLGGVQMKKRHKRARNGIVALTTVAVAGLFVYGQRVKGITKDVEYQISVEKEAVTEKHQKLTQMKQQLNQMDSPEYIRKVASEELGMVEKDTIVFKARE